MNPSKHVFPPLSACLLVLFLALGFQPMGQSTTKRVLFVGNSFIYFFNMPQMVSAMAEASGLTLITRQSTVGGSNLEQHWKGEKGTMTRKLLEAQEWDFVVFNNHSLSAINTPASFQTYGKKFAQLVKDKGAVPIFMMTWGYRSNPQLLDIIAPAYRKLAEDAGADLIPAGVLMQKARTLRPALKLYQDDKHPSANGSYLIALSFFKYLYGMQTDKLPPRLTTRDQHGELLYLCFLAAQDADFLQMLVDTHLFKLAQSE